MLELRSAISFDLSVIGVSLNVSRWSGAECLAMCAAMTAREQNVMVSRDTRAVEHTHTRSGFAIKFPLNVKID